MLNKCKIFLFLTFFLGASSLFAQDWQDFFSHEGNCSIVFPKMPQQILSHIRHKEEVVPYNIYLSSSDNENMLFLLLVATYPDILQENQKKIAMENFLNGLLSNDENNRLIETTPIKTQSFEAIDFFVRKNMRYMKGRILVANNTLYLLGIECADYAYNEDDYLQFMQSFSLKEE